MTVMPFRSTSPSSCVFCTVNDSYSRSFFAFSLSSLGYLDFVGFSPSVFLPIFTHFLFDWKLVWAGLIQRFQETVPLKIWDFRFRFSNLSVLKVFLANEIPLPSLSRYFFMIGYCCDDDKKLLVAEYMHHDTLAKHLFNWENQTFEWAMRLRVALKIAEVLDYGSIEGRPLYHDLNSYMVLFDEMRLNQSARQNIGVNGRKKKNLQKGQLK
ncbi:probable serine/threonine-protein kinase PBL15 [Pyrus x bretschneideri]|uniref:probable serine/threonine-protein kinase PBL15 n=1 Tax=Pyrus x bretschneideri TaxID=225117 RepID=UPI0020304C5E|nr:probable serine/threonine-protein kinase PBL15 [Pyrus x bretschneideri]XP_048425964.1 probable serine/threonine-protein kinase PBL15 [Pyrus x bretschneideri]XP_048425965.1 probable serine/threonine-protein kinase PBL15 [Pyrus x bretschneideri]XP_048425966.1 probable serine/threonine-protein kinase PBL15 [Pyrus x bretschneideri]XP_048425967.1 probable serine/threonine-protein kinase PBL15 [Pyrus x bretschneideri]XP_048425968.1 probable serine/threonine-protein kinase PBL15 [Pyrus x bretschne